MTLVPQDTAEHSYSIQTVWKHRWPKLLLNLKFGSNVYTFKFSLPHEEENSIRTFKFAQKKTESLSYLNDEPNISRLFGQFSDIRSASWLNTEGVDPKTKEVYVRSAHGTFTVGTQNDKFTELFFHKGKLSGRWILRNIPNVFAKEFLDKKKEVYLFWKPVQQVAHKDQTGPCPTGKCPLKTLQSNPMKKGKLTTKKCKFQMQINVDEEKHTFEGIASAEGTWVDLYGNKFIYTADFVKTLYNRMSSAVLSGKVTVDKEHNEEDKGLVTNVQLVQEPINHIIVKGTYSGTLDDVRGLSPELTLRSAWNEEFAGWVPVDVTPDRVSLVTNPACKICWIQEIR